MRTKHSGNRVELFLDSGAFSAWSKGAKIELKEYIEFVRDHLDVLSVYANLDVIGDPEATLQNQRKMEKAGLHPLPCFHYGEPIHYLGQYLKHYDYIALGGMVPVSEGDLVMWLDTLFSEHFCDQKGKPIVKVHGFGMTSRKLMLRYPWYSVDSTSWVMASRTGKIFVPKQRAGAWIYDETSWTVDVSLRNPSRSVGERHFENFPPLQQVVILAYVHEQGFSMGKSIIFRVKGKPEPDEDKNQRWFDKEKGLIEEIVERGLCNDYRMRDEFNVRYFNALEDRMPKWPWKWHRPQAILGGFGL